MVGKGIHQQSSKWGLCHKESTEGSVISFVDDINGHTHTYINHNQHFLTISQGEYQVSFPYIEAFNKIVVELNGAKPLFRIRRPCFYFPYYFQKGKKKKILLLLIAHTVFLG